MRQIIALILIIFSLEVSARDDDKRSETKDESFVPKINGLLFERDVISTIKKGKLSGPVLYLKEDSTDVRYIAMQFSYRDNVLHGSYIDFYPNGVVQSLIVNIVPNTKCPEHIEWFPFQSYCYSFYETGKLKAEGWGLIEEDIEFGNSVKIGTWKFYDANGTVTETEYPREFDSIDGRWLLF